MIQSNHSTRGYPSWCRQVIIIFKRDYGSINDVFIIIDMCREGSCCPAVTVYEYKVEIGEDENTCVLTADEFVYCSPLRHGLN